MDFQVIVDKLAQKHGDRVVEIILKIHTASTISELNFSQEDIDDIILPFTQLGLIKVEDRYFPIRPDEDKTRYNLYSISYIGESIVQSALRKIDYSKKVQFFLSRYPPKFLSFMNNFFMESGIYYGDEEEEYRKLLSKKEFAEYVRRFKNDLEKLMCGFWIRGHTSKKAEVNPPELIIVPEFKSLLEKQLPKEVIDREMNEFTLTNYIENFLLKPQIKNEWYEDFLRTVEKYELQNFWKEWLEELTSKGILANQVVLDTKELKAFLARKIEKIQKTLTERTGVERKIEEFFNALKAAKISPYENDKNDIVASCESRKDFSIFISAMYKILHDHMHIRDNDVIDPVRCYFHHGKKDKRQESNKAKFKEFCLSCVVDFEPKKDEWKILKERILERATEEIKQSHLSGK